MVFISSPNLLVFHLQWSSSLGGCQIVLVIKDLVSREMNFPGESVVISTPIAVQEVYFTGRHMYSKAFVTIRGDVEAKIDKIDASSIVRMPLRGGTTSKLESLMVSFTLHFWRKQTILWDHNRFDTGSSCMRKTVLSNMKSFCDDVAYLTALQILKMHGMEITKITGLSGAFNWLLKILANRVAKQFQEKIDYAFEKEITPSFEKVLNGRYSPPMNGSAELTETPFEGELQSDSPNFGMGYGPYVG